MKHIVLIIFITCFFVPKSQSQIVFEKYEHDFGVLSNWSQSPALFEFVNRHSEPIAILSFKKADGIKIKFPTNYIQPNQVETLFVYYEPLDLGRFDEKIQIITSVSNKPVEISIKGNVNSYLECPSAIQAGDPSTHIYIHQGVVIDKVTQQPIERVNVNLFSSKNGKSSVKTDGKGRFKKKLDIGQYVVQIDVDGYKFYDEDFYLNRNTPFLVFELEPVDYFADNTKQPKKKVEKSEIIENDDITEFAESKNENYEISEEEYEFENTQHQNQINDKQENPNKKTHLQKTNNKPVGNIATEPFQQQGVIMNSFTQQPVGKANIKLTHISTNTVYTYKTYSDGRFKKLVMPGLYQVSVTAKGYNLYGEKVDLNGPSKDLTIKLQPTQEVTVTHDDKPANFYQQGVIIDKLTQTGVNSANVMLKNLETGTAYTYKTFADGKFKKLIKPGMYQLVVEAPGYKVAGKNIKLDPTSGIVQLELEKEKVEAEPKTAVVFDQKAIALDSFTKEPIGKSFISFYNKDYKSTYSFKTYSDGKFDKKIKPGNYIVRIKADGYKPFEKEMEIFKPTDELTFYLSPVRKKTDLIIGERKEEVIKVEKKVAFEDKLNEVKKKYESKEHKDIVKVEKEPIKSNTQLKTEITKPETGELLSRSRYAANNIVFLVDVSASMSKSRKIENLKHSMTHLTGILRDIDNISIMTYSTQPSLVIASIPANLKDTIYKSIDSMNASGFTYGLRGLNKAYELAEENFIPNGNNEVIIATDGEFNSPDYSEIQLISMISKYARKDITLTVIGFGSNAKAIRTMKRMSAFGKGNFLHIKDRAQAESILIEEIKLNSEIVE